MKPKVFLLVLCGAADRPVQALGGRTPLEAAETTQLDWLARRGVQGLLTVIDDRICPETDSGMMALIGYDPLRYYTGRGALEALGAGFMDVDENAVGFRVNFGHYDDTTGELDRRTARDLSLDEQQRLVSEIRLQVALRGLPEVSCAIAGFGRHRGIVCFKSSGRPLSANVSNTDPGFRRVGPFGVPNENSPRKPVPCQPLDDTEAAAFTARLVNQYVKESTAVMARSAVNQKRRARGALPANLLLFRDAGGHLPSLEPFAGRYGWALSLYGQVPAEHGLCKLIGGAWNEARPHPGQTEQEYYRDLVEAVRNDPADVIVVHLKAADEPGHDGRTDEKVRAIGRLDRDFLRGLVQTGTNDDVYIITSDHATPCELGIHSADRVPALVCGRGLPTDSTGSFCEREAANGGLPVVTASELLPYVNRVLCSTRSHGAARRTRYVPGNSGIPRHADR